jgi:disulfide bond formation protein DsbB
MNELLKLQNEKFIGALPYIAWIIALLSVAGSPFFSEVMGLPPCVLCW